YIGIRKKGTTYHIDAIEKQQEKRIEDLPNRHLVASKNGEIESIFVKKGVGKVAVNDIVEKGDLLVSGEIEKEEEEEEGKDKIEDENEKLQKVKKKKKEKIKSKIKKKGLRKVAVNEIVEKGDLLVSGEIEKEAEEEEDKDKNEDDKEQLQKVAAEGEVYANTWYEMDVTSPL